MSIVAIPNELRRNFLANRQEFLRNLACIPMRALSPFYRQRSAIYNCIDYTRENAWDFVNLRFDSSFTCENPEVFRYAHFDLAETGDRVGFAMCHAPYHVDRDVTLGDKVQKIRLPYVYFDFLGVIEVSKEKELEYQLIPEIVLELRRKGFYLDLITFDRFQSSMIIQILIQEGFRVSRLSIDRTAFSVKVVKAMKTSGELKDWHIKRESTGKQYADAHNSLKNAIYHARCSIPAWEKWILHHPDPGVHPFIEEAEGAEIKEGGVVDHGTFSKIDLVSGMAGAAYNCQNNAPDMGSAVGVYDDAMHDHRFEQENAVRADNAKRILQKINDPGDMQQFLQTDLAQYDHFDLLHSNDNPYAELGL